MDGYQTIDDPATEEQREHLRQLGVCVSVPIPRNLANILIDFHSATERQRACLERLGLAPDGPLSRAAASERIADGIQARRQLAPTPRQEAFLRSRGLWTEGLTRGEASDRIGEVLAGQGKSN
jgi:hypothetical protein